MGMEGLLCCSPGSPRGPSVEGPLFLLQSQGWVRLWFALSSVLRFSPNSSSPLLPMQDLPREETLHGAVEINAKCAVETPGPEEEADRPNVFVLHTADGGALQLSAETEQSMAVWLEALHGRVRPEWASGDSCSACSARFGIITRKHHCRKCGEIFCDSCSLFRSTFPEIGYNSPVRCCEDCLVTSRKAKTVRTKSAYEKWLEKEGRVLAPSMKQSFATSLSDRFFTKGGVTEDSDYSTPDNSRSISSSPISEPSLFSYPSLHISEPNLFSERSSQCTVGMPRTNSFGALSKRERRKQCCSKRDLKEWECVRKGIRSSSMVS